MNLTRKTVGVFGNNFSQSTLIIMIDVVHGFEYFNLKMKNHLRESVQSAGENDRTVCPQISQIFAENLLKLKGYMIYKPALTLCFH
jgi:hypothetical protein